MDKIKFSINIIINKIKKIDMWIQQIACYL